ncbi:MAG: alpha/beta hydrolase family protein, partial [Exilispira sp.]
MKKEKLLKYLRISLLLPLFLVSLFILFSFTINQSSAKSSSQLTYHTSILSSTEFSLKNIESAYLGILAVGDSNLRIVLIISKSLLIENNLEAILISIDQGGSMIPASSVIYDKANLIINFNNIKARITILSNVEDKLKTIFQLGSFKTELIFSKIPGSQEPLPFFLRFDDRGSGLDNNIFLNSDIFDFVSDLVCQINYLKSLDFIDSSRIGVLCHSEGGLISFILASNYSDDISFIISLAGPVLRGDKILLLQQQAIAKASNIKEKEIKKMIDINTSLYELVIKHK